MIILPQHARPSFANGFARSPDEGVYPHLLRGRVAHWCPALGLQGETLRDVALNRSHATLTNMDMSTDWTIGSNGRIALDFDGDNDFGELGTIGSDHPLMMAGSPGSIVTWALRRDPTDSFPRIFDKSNGGAAASGYAMYMSGGSGQTRSLYLQIDTSQHTRNADDYALDTWVHGAFRWDFDGDNVAMFLNGAELSLDVGGSGNPIPNVATNARIGTWNHSTGRELNGQIAELILYNRMLSNAEVRQLHQLGPGGSLARNVVYPFVEPAEEAALSAGQRVVAVT